MKSFSFEEGIKSGFLPFIWEEEGRTNLISTRTAKINAIIKDLKYIRNKVSNPNDYIEEVLSKYGLTEDMLTDSECRKINESVNRY